MRVRTALRRQKAGGNRNPNPPVPRNRRSTAVADFVAVKAQAVHKDQQAADRRHANPHFKTLRSRKSQQPSTNRVTCFGSRGPGVRIPPPRPSIDFEISGQKGVPRPVCHRFQRSPRGFCSRKSAVRMEFKAVHPTRSWRANLSMNCRVRAWRELTGDLKVEARLNE
jgi:hypothetical protein